MDEHFPLPSLDKVVRFIKDATEQVYDPRKNNVGVTLAKSSTKNLSDDDIGHILASTSSLVSNRIKADKLHTLRARDIVDAINKEHNLSLTLPQFQEIQGRFFGAFLWGSLVYINPRKAE